MCHNLFVAGRVDGFGGCVMPNNQKGSCLPLKDCVGLNALTEKKKLSIADRLFLRRSRCGYIGSSPLVCCQEKREIATRFDGSPLQFDDLPSDCGSKQLNHNVPLALIVGGTATQIHDSPWLVLLQYENRMFTLRIQFQFIQQFQSRF